MKIRLNMQLIAGLAPVYSFQPLITSKIHAFYTLHTRPQQICFQLTILRTDSHLPICPNMTPVCFFGRVSACL